MGKPFSLTNFHISTLLLNAQGPCVLKINLQPCFLQRKLIESFNILYYVSDGRERDGQHDRIREAADGEQDELPLELLDERLTLEHGIADIFSTRQSRMQSRDRGDLHEQLRVKSGLQGESEAPVQARAHLLLQRELRAESSPRQE